MWRRSPTDQLCPTCECVCEETFWNAGSIIDGLVMGGLTYLVLGDTVRCPRCKTKYPRQKKSTTVSGEPVTPSDRGSLES